ncbi:MAG: hypothetical protein AAFQ40_15100 [Cyanobacteria bacterium J06623_5]
MESFRQFSSDSVYTSKQARRQLERLWSKPSVRHSLCSPSWAEQLGQSLLRFMTGDQQIRIWQKKTQSGLVWCAYDPFSDQLKTCASESELRIWLEHRHRDE